MTASAVLRVGSHAPVPLQGTPAVAPPSIPGEITIVLGYTTCGPNCPVKCKKPVILTISSLEWDDDLLQAAADAGARGFSIAGMRRAVPA